MANVAKGVTSDPRRGYAGAIAWLEDVAGDDAVEAFRREVGKRLEPGRPVLAYCQLRRAQHQRRPRSIRYASVLIGPINSETRPGRYGFDEWVMELPAWKPMPTETTR